jgi:hypothetical protein
MCDALYKRDGMQLTICAYYLWEMPVNFGLMVSFTNMEGWKGICGEVREVNSTKDYTTSYEFFHWLLNGCCICLLKYNKKCNFNCLQLSESCYSSGHIVTSYGQDDWSIRFQFLQEALIFLFNVMSRAAL